MHIEFGHYLSANLASEFPELKSLPKVEICEHSELGFVTSPILFEIASMRAKEVLPVHLAEIALEQCKDNNLFDLSVGGAGYLNANPTSVGAATFVNLVEERGVSALFSDEALNPEIATNISVPEFQFAIDLKSLRDRARLYNAEDLALLPEALDFENLVMLLAIAADREIELNIYLNALNGKENIPWYLNRFFECWDGVQKQVSSGQRQDLRLQKLGERLLFSFRISVLRPLYYSRPEQSLKAVLDGVHAFFSWYNLPSTRAALSDLSKETVLPFLLWADAVELFYLKLNRLLMD